MEWTQEQLENLYQEVNRRVADDPEFRAKMQDATTSISLLTRASA